MRRSVVRNDRRGWCVVCRLSVRVTPILGVGYVGIAHLAVLCTHFQLSHFCGQLATLLLQFGFQIIPILTGTVSTRVRFNDVNDDEFCSDTASAEA